jgi:uncharacterized protein (DUF1697 family)
VAKDVRDAAIRISLADAERALAVVLTNASRKASAKAKQRYVAFLRGVSPLNARMPALKRAFERAGFADVTTVLGSGNVVFSAPASSNEALARQAEAAMQEQLGKSFFTLVRSVTSLRKLLASDPYAAFRLEPGSKRVVTFLSKKPAGRLALPIRGDAARILRVQGLTVFSAYVPTPKSPAFMALLEKTFGKDITTRTWETVDRAVR